MSRTSHRKHRPRAATVFAILLLLAGLGAMGASLWEQESEVIIGADAYEALAQRFKRSDMPETLVNPIRADLDQTAEQLVGMKPTQQELSADSENAAVHAAMNAPVIQLPLERIPLSETDGEAERSVVTGLTEANLSACKAVNSDFVAWLQIPGTDVDYPVVLTDDVEYYLNHTFYGDKNVIGCLFSLERTDYKTPSANIAIYGHHMRRSRATTMFQPLHAYKNAGFRNANDTILLDTLYGAGSYEVFAVINKRESDWDASVADFASDTEYQSFLDTAKAWALYDTGVTVTPDDFILTLITCDRDYHAEDGQLIVMAVKR